MSLPAELARPIDVLLIDNFDSFTWNLYQYLCLVGADVTVIRNNAISPDAFPQLDIKSLIISPGPGHPISDSGISRDAIKYFTGKVPILGVCMGLECLVDVFGGQIAYAGEIVHGKVSHIRHDGCGVFHALPQSIKSTRYHSLSAGMSTLPSCLAVTATTEESGVIMGVRHREYTMEAVQYHPESILSEAGDKLLENFLKLKGGRWDDEANKPLGVTVDQPATNRHVNGINDYSSVASTSKAPSILEKIYAQRMRDVEVAKATPGTTSADLDALLAMSLAPPLVSFLDRLKSTAQQTGRPALMAEIKRASPSKGAIAPDANAAKQARTYALAGASVISVLTEPTWFKGTLLDMRLARQAIDTLPNRPAILRKDFIFDEYQIAEARLHGADTVLLIVAMLQPDRLSALYAYAQSLGMEPLVEVNSVREMERALELGARVVGVNNRNLHDFVVDMGTTSRIAEMMDARGEDVVLCALSGITGPTDVQTYMRQGIRAILVGEALMRAADTRAFIQQLLGLPEEPAESKGKAVERPLVKICGIRNEEEALGAMEAGADMLGLVFVPGSRRHISLEQAQKISVAVHASRFARPIRETLTHQHTTENAPWFASHARRVATALADPDAPARPLLVGVFQNQPLTAVVRAIEVAQLDMVQLHGSEPAEWVRHIPVPVVRAFHVGSDKDSRTHALRELTRPGLHAFALLDAVVPGRKDGLSGGAGVVLDWQLARSIAAKGELSEAESTTRMPIVLAGGLNPDNVREAVKTVHPWAVDVSGGVEYPDGRGKHLQKVRAFIKAAKAVEE